MPALSNNQCICNVCGGAGWYRDSVKNKSCPYCDGKGWIFNEPLAKVSDDKRKRGRPSVDKKND